MTRLVIVGIGAGGAIGLFALIFTWIATSKPFTDADKLDVAMRQAMKGDFATAAAIADAIADDDLSDEDKAKKRLANGLLLWDQAQEYLEHKQSLQTFDKAYEQLHEASEFGFPTGYEGLGNFALGMVQAKLGQGDEALPPLRKGALRYPNGRSDALAAIIEILLQREPVPTEDVEKELAHWRSLPGLGPGDLDLARRMEAMLLAKNEDWQGAMGVLEPIEAGSPSHFPAELQRVQVLEKLAQRELNPEKQKELLEAALEKARGVNEAPLANSSIRRSSMYMTAKLLRSLGRQPEALSIFSRIRLGHPETPESLTSGMEEIEILYESDRIDEALAILMYLNTHVAELRWYDSGRDSLESVRRRLIQVGQNLIKDQAYDEAIAYAQQLPMLCKEADRVRLMAESNRGHGEQIATDGGYVVDRFGATPLRLRGETLTAAQDYFRRAGHFYDKLSTQELRSPDYSDILWSAIECYRTAKDVEACNTLLDRYLQYENRGKRPRALLAKGENYFTVQEHERALQILNQLLEFYSDSPLVYPARILASQCLRELSRFDEASELLLKNLYDGSLAPDSPLWRDSLFDLGELLMRRGELLVLESNRIRDGKLGIDKEIDRLTESQDHLRGSIDRFKDALLRYGDDPRSYQLEYSIAQAYRLASALPNRLLKDDLIEAESKRKRHVRQRTELLTSAKDHYIALRKKMQQQLDPLLLDESKQNMLRNCFFGEADILFELGDYVAALDAYSAAATQYMNEPEVLEALAQKSRCHELLGNKKEARQVLLQAQQILKRIPEEKNPRFAIVTRFDRAQWVKQLEWMTSLPVSTK